MEIISTTYDKKCYNYFAYYVQWLMATNKTTQAKHVTVNTDSTV